MDKHFSIGQAAQILGVCISTLRRWEEVSYLTPAFRTPGKHRRYSWEQLNMMIHGGESACALKPKMVLGYARVSSHDQKEDLKRQIHDIEKACKKLDSGFVMIHDLGSGINYKKKGLQKLLAMVLRREVSTLVLTHRDRLLRFGSQLLLQVCEFCNVKVIILDETEKLDFDQRLASDLIEIITVFTSRLYGRRAQEKRKYRQAESAKAA